MSPIKHAVILAAGVGSRLRPLTLDKPKCMVRVGGLPILEYQLRGYEAAGVAEIHIVTGFRSDIIRAWIDTRLNRCQISVTENFEFDLTNNMYSLHLVADKLAGQPFFLSNGDVVFEPEIVIAMANLKTGSAIAVDGSVFHAESMKVVSDKLSGKLCGISKAYTSEESLAVSIDFYRFSAETSRALFDVVSEFVLSRGERHLWTEVALHEVLAGREHDIVPEFIDHKRWIEIDNLEDLSQGELLFAPAREAIVAAGAFVCDIDGTLMIDGRPIAGALEFLEYVRQTRQVSFCTNNSARSRREHAAVLATAGFTCAPDDVLSSSEAAKEFLSARSWFKIFVLGTPSLKEDFTADDFDCQAKDPQCIVVGFDTTLSYEGLAKASQLIASGCPWILTHPDVSCPTSQGPIPDAGAIGALLKMTTGSAPLAVLGKPSPSMLSPILKTTRLLPNQIVIIGDRLGTDIRMARSAGCLSVLVLSGISNRLDLERSDFQPDLVVDSVASLHQFLTMNDH